MAFTYAVQLFKSPAAAVVEIAQCDFVAALLHEKLWRSQENDFGKDWRV